MVIYDLLFDEYDYYLLFSYRVSQLEDSLRRSQYTLEKAAEEQQVQL